MSDADNYGNTEARLNTIMNTAAAEFWILIKRCKHYYETEINPQYDKSGEFMAYLGDTWGISFNMRRDMISHAQVIDEAKYAMFLLKFS